MRSVTRELGRVLDSRRRSEADVVPVLVAGRNTDGTLLVQALDGTCTARGEPRAAYAGQVLRDPRGDFKGGGSSGVAGLFGNGALDFYWVEELVPNVYQAGAVYTVEVRGVGLLEDLRFEFLLPGTDLPNPDITITQQLFDSSELIYLDIAVGGGAPELELSPFAYGTDAEGEAAETTLARRLLEAYTQVANPDPRRPYLAFGLSAGTLRAWRNLDGDFLEDRASISAGGATLPARSPVVILSDPAAKVGAGSLAFLDGSGPGLVVWDVAGAVKYQRATGGLLFSIPVWWQGWIYWTEQPANDTAGVTAVNFYKARADLSSVTLLSTTNVTVGPSLQVDWTTLQEAYLTNEGATLHTVRHCVETLNNDTSFNIHLALPMNGSGATVEEIDPFRSLAADPPVGINGGSEAFGSTSGGQLLVHDDTGTNPWTTRWPDNPAWELDTGLNPGLSPNLGYTPEPERVLYGLKGIGLAAKGWVLKAPAAGGALSADFEVDKNPTYNLRATVLYPED